MKFIYWLFGDVNEVAEPRIYDRLIERYNRLQNLREIARKQAAESRSDMKLIQANRLINQVTNQLNSRSDNYNRFNLN